MSPVPKKTVHFAPTPQRTPSPPSSDASVMSSPGPSTPPQPAAASTSPTIVRARDHPPWSQDGPRVSHARRPSFSSLPVPDLPVATPDADTIIDPLLTYSRSAATPPLIWDLFVDPNNITFSTTAGGLSLEDLTNCAAYTSAKDVGTPLSHMVLIFSRLPHLEVDVEPADDDKWMGKPLPFVCVGDVIHVLYRALRAPVEEVEFETRGAREQAALRAAWDLRMERMAALDREAGLREARRGIRTIDYLGERRMFLGLRAALPHEVPPRRAPSEVFVVETARVR